MLRKNKYFLLAFLSFILVVCATVYASDAVAVAMLDNAAEKDNLPPDLELVPCGVTIGVRINTRGVMVLGTGSFKGEDGVTYKPSEGKLRPGDMILRVGDTEIKNIDGFKRAVNESGGKLNMEIQRDEENMTVEIEPQVSSKDNVSRIGAWIRDSTKGIGTITYYNPKTGAFGALGHGIMDVDTKRLMSVENGIIMASSVTMIKKGAKGVPGELEGAVQENRVLGEINKNSPCGIYGEINAGAGAVLPSGAVKVADRSKVREGAATVMTNVASDKVKEYAIVIESVNHFAVDDTKGMVIRITDPELLKLTNGIVQGMSGSPILQDGKLIGAVTHVFVQDPAKGYGIFIANMIRQEKLIP
jgi:stage IV sporulation protein B